MISIKDCLWASSVWDWHEMYTGSSIHKREVHSQYILRRYISPSYPQIILWVRWVGLLMSRLHTLRITPNSLQILQPFGNYTSECSGSISACKSDVEADESTALVKDNDLTCDGLKYNWWNVLAVDQSACWSTSESVAPVSKALDVAAPLVECVQNLVLSMPALEREHFTQRAMLDAFMGACGFEIPPKKAGLGPVTLCCLQTWIDWFLKHKCDLPPQNQSYCTGC